MTVTIDGGAGVTFPDGVQQTNGVTNTGGDPRYYAARAWVNYKGTATRAIRASVNIASVTRTGIGTFDLVFTTAMPDANYAIVVSAGQSTTYVIPAIDGTPTAAGFSIRVLTTSGGSPTPFDPDYLHVVVFR